MLFIREIFTVLYFALAAGLAVCAYHAHHSNRQNAENVKRMLLSLIPALVGNMMIISSSNPQLSVIGCYLNFLSMNFLLFASLHFTRGYCRVEWPGVKLRTFIHFLLLFNIVQMLLNPVFHHAFELQAVELEGRAYYTVISHWGLNFHRYMSYGVYFLVLGIFTYRAITAPRIYAERYVVILLTMVFVSIWQAFYMISQTPINTSMIGYSIFGLLIYYFALHYRPMRLLDHMLADISSDMNESIFFFDAVGHCIWANEPGIRLSGIQNDDYETARELLTAMFGDIGEKKEEFSEKRVIAEKHYQLEKRTAKAKNGKINGSFLRIRDITEEQRTLERTQYIARHDDLTGLYNKGYLYKRTGELVKAECPGSFLVLYIDIKGFKIVNDIFEPSFGDYILQCVAKNIREELPEGCVCGRITGDQFGVCMPVEVFDEALAERNLKDYVIRHGSVEYKVIMHEGVYTVKDPDMDVSVMYDHANMALRTIKNEYNRHIAYYTDELREHVLWDQEISAQLPEAIAKRQLVPYLQPIINAEGKTVGAEALARWLHPVHGFLPPDRFIPVFEKNGMIANVDKYMWRCACEILAQWKRRGIDMFVSVNISPKDFYFMDVAAEISSLVQEFGIAPGKLRLEITETVVMSDMENRIRIIESLRKKGFLVEMDDFGSGYSSLNMLKDLPVDVIKIDMASIDQADGNRKTLTILQNMIRMIEELGILSLTEGVENPKQYQALSKMGCKMFQGYYFSKPMPLETFEAFCRKAA